MVLASSRRRIRTGLKKQEKQRKGERSEKEKPNKKMRMNQIHPIIWL
jgi:hypothetical protein